MDHFVDWANQFQISFNENKTWWIQRCLQKTLNFYCVQKVKIRCMHAQTEGTKEELLYPLSNAMRSDIYILLWLIKGLNSTCLFLMEVWSDRGSTFKFRNARSAFRNLHVDPLSLHTSMRNKQVEFNPYIYTLTTLSKLYRFGYEISVF